MAASDRVNIIDSTEKQVAVRIVSFVLKAATPQFVSLSTALWSGVKDGNSFLKIA
jgi:hypothetical protein